MDKLLETNYKGSQVSKLYRFQCDCLHAADALDVSIEYSDTTPPRKFVEFTFDIRPQGFWDRLRACWRLLNGSWTWNTFILREEDQGNMSRILDPNVKYEDLP